MVLLAIDIGNTSTSLGLYQGQRWQRICRVRTNRAGTSDEVSCLLSNLFPSLGGEKGGLEGAVVSSVVPHLNWIYEVGLKDAFGVGPLLVGPELDFGIRWGQVQPDRVGVDRLVNSAAAFQIYGGPIIVVDMGTATTFDLVSREGVYLGGVIAPGFYISAEALFERAAQLGEVRIEPPSKVIGTNTGDCIRSGLFYGAIGGVDEIVRRMAKESKIHPKVVATGGASAFVAGDSTTIEQVVPHLTLDGLRMIYKRAKNSKNFQTFKKKSKKGK